MSGFDRIPEIARDWIASGHRVAFATVMQTWGSAPRQAGAQLVIAQDGSFEGSVSGGCVEGAVVVEAQAAIEAGENRVLEFGVSDDDAFASGLACGGTIRILVEPVEAEDGAGVEADGDGGQGMDIAMLSALVAARAQRKPVAITVDLTTWQRHLIAVDQADPALAARFVADKSGLEDAQMVIIHNPPLRLIVVGAVHIAQALVPMAELAGYDVSLIDPRAAFASQARFPGRALIPDWPDEAVTALAPDARTALVTLAHDPKIDDPALLIALAADTFYVGCLGSRRTHAKRLDRLAAAGVASGDLARLHGPAGLDIGAQTPAEIALSVLAEITGVLRQKE